MTESEIAAFLRAARADDERTAVVVERRRPRRDRARGLRLVDHPITARIPQAPLWEFLLTFGARWGEMRSLVWCDVDLGEATVTLRGSTTKTEKARCVPITREFAAELERLRALDARALGRAPGATDRVFLSPQGHPHREDTTNARRVYRRMLDAAGIERIDGIGRRLDVHALRGTCATALARRGVAVNVAQRLLGHATPDMTMKHYVRMDDGDVRAAVEMGAVGSKRTEAGGREVGA